MKLRPAGPGAFLIDAEAPPSPETARRLAQVRAALAASPPPEVRDIIPAFEALLVEHRPTLTRHARDAWLSRAAARAPEPPAPRRHRVRVAYGVDADRDELERRLGLSWEEIVRLHRGHEATVAFVGFTPGFPYLLGLPASLTLPRRERPLEHIPAGAVAVADGYGGIYPTASPGGWWVLGRSDARPFDPEADPPARMTSGDVLTFEAVAAEALQDAAPDLPGLTDGPVEVLEAWPGGADLQGSSRWGVGHYGMAQAGALDPVALEAANDMVGNARFALGLEWHGQPLALRSGRELHVAVAGGGIALALEGRPVPAWRAFRWPAGAVLELTPDPKASGRIASLAVAGGWQGACHGGSDSTDHRAALGGSRRWLRPGDRLAVGEAGAGRVSAHPGRPHYPGRAELRLHAGPQYAPEAFERLLYGSFRVAGMDRTGVRLDGPRVPLESHEITSEGSPLGAVQVPPDGRPIVLLADRGRTGGYAKPAVVDARDLWRLAQARGGDEVWFLDARRGSPEVEPLDFGAWHDEPSP